MLATFLRRAATVARSQGADLRVVGVREGSLAVILKALRKSAAKEFTEKPIDTTIKTAGLVVAVVGAIRASMSLAKSSGSSITMAAVELVERHEVTEITIVTRETNTVIMNEELSRRVREKRVRGGRLPAQPKAATGHISQRVVELSEEARRGDLSGEFLLVEGNLHFRPDGYNFLVPVDTTVIPGIRQLLPSRYYRVTGRIATLDGQPDHIVVVSAVPH